MSPSFYRNAAWRRLRKRILTRDHYHCVMCNAFVGGIGAARVDHIIPTKQAPDRLLDPTNLRTLCASCDNKSHREKGFGIKTHRIERQAYGSDERGYPLKPDHPWVG
jgi:5-methylcytosine-specific restriction endonuclease McrA